MGQDRFDQRRMINLYDWKTIGRSPPSRGQLEIDPQKYLYSRWKLLKTKQKRINFNFVYLYKQFPNFEIKTFDCILTHEPFTDVVLGMKQVVNDQIIPKCICGKCPQESTKMIKKTVEPLVIPIEPGLSLNQHGSPPYLELWVDCLPTKCGNYLFLNSLIAERAPKICAAHPTREGIPVDIRCIEFGKGKGYLADDFRKNPPTGRVIARSGELSDAVIEVLIPLANEVHLRT